MVRVRKLVLAIAAASALTSGVAHALGLGEVTLRSSLNQPLDAEIELLEVRDLGSTEVKPSLASPDDFSKAGVDRQYFLQDLKFTPVLKPNGRSVIRVTSSKPVREPYLNFLVEVLWPNGRLLREYTLLLDPPLYSPQTAVAAAPRAPVTTPAPAPRPAAAPAPARGGPGKPPVAAKPPATVTPRPAAPAPAVKAPTDRYRTVSNDTLWEIAERTRVSGSVHQAMLAIQELNPDAFIDGNINRLKSGQVLRLPNEQQIASRSRAEALAQVQVQNTAWREGRAQVGGKGKRQLDATKRSSAGAAPEKVETKDSLRLVSAANGKSSSGSDKGAAGERKALNDKLAVTQESLDSTRRENEELKSRMSDLQSQMDKLQRLIQLKDGQLAKLQASMAAQGKQPTAAAPTHSVPTAEALSQPAAPAAPPPPQSEAPAAKPETPATKPAEPAASTEPAPADSATEASTSFMDGVLANPMLLLLVGGSAVVALLVLIMMLSRRNAMKAADESDGGAAQDSGAAFDGDLDLKDDDSGDFLDGAEQKKGTAPDDATEAKPEGRVTAQTSDVISEADIYIAYGRFNQAAELLLGAINDEPQRSDLRLKLLEVYAELGDREGFVRQESELREIGGAGSQIDKLKGKYPAMGASAAATVTTAATGAAASKDFDISLDDLTLDNPPAADVSAPEQNLDDAFDLSLDDLNKSLDIDLPEAKPAAASPAPAPLDDLDFGDLEFDSPAEPAKATSDLDFDLDTGGVAEPLRDDLSDFSFDLEPAKSSSVDEDEFLLSLDGDFDQPSEAEKPASADKDTDADLSMDFDLSLPDKSPAEHDSFTSKLDEVSAELDQLSESLQQAPESTAPESVASSGESDGDDDFDFLSGTDETSTKLDLARAYIDMGDTEGARDILDEILTEGSETQQQEARELIARLA